MPLSTIIKKNCKVCGKVAVESSRLDFGESKLITLECGHITSEEVLSAANYDDLTVIGPNGQVISLMPFQKIGVQFAEKSNARCLIADEQGLGKTVQAAALVKLHFMSLAPITVVTKTTIKVQWMWELMRWCGIKNIQVIMSGKEKALPGFDVVITSYDMLKDENLYSMTVKPKTLILDEVQAIKNHLSGRAKAVQFYGKTAEHIIALSGTPIKNNAGEYFTILNLLQPSRFPEYNRYLRDYTDYYETFYGSKVGGLKDVESFKAATADFIIRRTQEEVLPDLFALKQPRKFHHVELNKKLTKAYESAQAELEALMYADEDENTTTASIAIMTKMRQIAGISKVTECSDYVAEHIISTGRKIVVFCHHHNVVNLLEAEINSWLSDGGFNPAVIYRAGDDRQSKIKSFSDSNTPVMILSTLASGEGLDGLQHLCSDMIMLERQWNPANEEQTEGRLARIGQTKPVNFIYMIVSGTIDEYFTELVEQKRSIVAGTLDGKTVQWNESGLMKELAMILATSGKKKWSL